MSELFFKKFEVISLNWGYNMSCINNENYTKDEIHKFIAINYGTEFSDINENCNVNFHMGIIVSNSFLNKATSVLVAPITTKKESDILKHKNKFILLKDNYLKLNNDSVILLNRIREIDKNRIKKHLFFLKDYHHTEFNKRLKFVFGV